MCKGNCSCGDNCSCKSNITVTPNGHNCTNHDKHVELYPADKRKFPVITLCGSTKFKDEFMQAQKELSLAGYIVISVGLFGHSGDTEVWTEDTKEMLDEMHRRKIDMADEIYIINVNGYIGESTRNEIKYAEATGKKVTYRYICKDCKNYTGIHDWNLSCLVDDHPGHPCGFICNDNTPACKHYELQQDNQENKSEKKGPRCRKCVYEVTCSRDKDSDGNCPDYKRDAPDGGFYG